MTGICLHADMPIRQTAKNPGPEAIQASSVICTNIFPGPGQPVRQSLELVPGGSSIMFCRQGAGDATRHGRLGCYRPCHAIDAARLPK